MNTPIRFLTIEHIFDLHDFSQEHAGGSSGVRDLGALESAVSMPRQEFGGSFLHEDLPSKAAAYMYHLASNHPFIDGNKRTAVLAALTFLDLNGVSVLPCPIALEEVTWRLASSDMTKAELTSWFREQIGQESPSAVSSE